MRRIEFERLMDFSDDSEGVPPESVTIGQGRVIVRRYSVDSGRKTRLRYPLDGDEAVLDVEDLDWIMDVFTLRSGGIVVIGGSSNCDENVFVIDVDGTLSPKFRIPAMGCVNQLMATDLGDIWVGYSDEGSGDALESYRIDGTRNPISGEAHFDVECYALNIVDRDNTYFYTSAFKIYIVTNLVARRMSDALYTNGSSAFSVNDSHALFAGSYDKEGILRLLNLHDGTEELFLPVDASQKALPVQLVSWFSNRSKNCVGSGADLFLVEDDGVYVCNLNHLRILK